MKKIVIFASGSGTNAENIMKYFVKTKIGTVAAVFTNNPNAQVIDRAKNYGVTIEVFSKDQLIEGEVLQKIDAIQPDWIILAGFLLKFPQKITAAYPKKIINIHPALLPKYGGKGMYGMHIHRAIVENKEKETGITIHFVNENYDEGAIIFQQSIILTGEETPEVVATKIHELEYKYFPEVIEKLMKE
ncbi:MAG TPA: phosphoribosylglycinamide formyltransferase [Flavobacterium sp.]|jgi:phosphoribosylglycinamide formyltransferase-1|uniref:phosphoribosylglycinamide formyltransferase n=1 Tax=Flavobacterium sp. TaxID=239 RepID=UPI001B5085BE|nr:phosphoribosylglycinamide formyltransferase [Flavobacterium sp.]MBP7182327.1 phosphoribosylglycinamide formyltransferase [Flavobacterium sp.]MBP7318127.1 phosphoribosylglycinamide formyltransferase [Flavobacterium sp.]MBP8886552.1 phosphoribosylglycinamide formyltransferase [Flavobacterium sp.]HRM11426.1 phosphoribosylglycinamide formyltransferase [Flavobacterium sp.]HRM44896.1 phosphoribosylglycinamide formyltransferase [Flavobacterium sp.]